MSEAGGGEEGPSWAPNNGRRVARRDLDPAVGFLLVTSPIHEPSSGGVCVTTPVSRFPFDRRRASAAPPAAAQETASDTLLTVEHYLDWEQVADPQLSPDGSQVIYTGAT